MKRLQSKITLTYAVLTLLAVSAFALFASVATQRSLTRQKILELSQRIEAVDTVLESESRNGPDAIRIHVRELAQAMGLRITLIDETGRVLIDSDIPKEKIQAVENHLQRPEIRQALNEAIGTDTRHSATVGQDFLYVAKIVRSFPATEDSARVKFIRLSAHLADIQAMVKEQRNNILGAGAVVLLLVLAVSMLVSRRISEPISEIGKSVEKIRSGDLDTRITVRGDDEVGQVARAVNEMVDTLKADIVKLRKLEHVRSEFLGNVSHELRTPIFSLQGFLETLIEGAVDDPTVNREFLKKAYNHSVRLNTLLGELITISHIESGEMKMSFRYFNLYEFLHGLVEEMSPVALLNSTTLSLASDVPSDVEVLGDKERLRVVCENLIENAIKYNKPNGEVKITYHSADGKVIISIADTGVGIEPEHLPRIFERFYRIDKNRSRDVGGTGLGLAIVKHIIEAHESHVDVQSEIGKGSTFSFSLKT